MPNLNEYVPDHLREYPEISALMDAIQPEMDAIWERLEQVWEDQYTDTMSPDMYKRWRRALRLTYATDPAYEAETDPEEKAEMLSARAEIVRRLMLLKHPISGLAAQQFVNAAWDVDDPGSPLLASVMYNTTTIAPGSARSRVLDVWVYDREYYEADGETLTRYTRVPRGIIRWVRYMIPACLIVRHIVRQYIYDPSTGSYRQGDYTTREEVLL